MEVGLDAGAVFEFLGVFSQHAGQPAGVICGQPQAVDQFAHVHVGLTRGLPCAGQHLLGRLEVTAFQQQPQVIQLPTQRSQGLCEAVVDLARQAVALVQDGHVLYLGVKLGIADR